MWVKDYMNKKLNTITKDKTLAEAVKQMVEQEVNSLIVVEENKPVGLVTSQILIQTIMPEYLNADMNAAQFEAEGVFDRYADRNREKKVSDFMYTDFHIISEKDTMIEAAAFLAKGERRTLPVVDNGGILVGVITRTCVKVALYDVLYKETKENSSNKRENNLQ